MKDARFQKFTKPYTKFRGIPSRKCNINIIFLDHKILMSFMHYTLDIIHTVLWSNMPHGMMPRRSWGSGISGWVIMCKDVFEAIKPCSASGHLVDSHACRQPFNGRPRYS